MEQKIIWVIGVPRSGTTVVASFLGSHAQAFFNEPFKQFPVRKVATWRLPPCSPIVFKYCCNWLDADQLISLYPGSQFVHVARNPRDVVFSMYAPKADSQPYRPFADVGDLWSAKRFANTVNWWSSFIRGCLSVGERHPGRYHLLVYERMAESVEELANFCGLPLDINRMKFRNRNLPETALAALDPLWERHAQLLPLRRTVESLLQ